MTFRFHRRQNTPVGRMGHALCGSVVGQGPPLVALPIPFIYYPFDGDLLNYGSSGAMNDALLFGSGSSFIAGSMPGKQALHLTTASFIQVGGGVVPMPGTGDATLSSHNVLTDVSGETFLLSALYDGNGRGVELFGSCVASGNSRSQVDVLTNVNGAAYTIADVVGFNAGMDNPPLWNVQQVILDRLGSQLAYGAVNGLIGPVTSNLATAAGRDIFEAAFAGSTAKIGSRINTFGNVRYSVSVAEWAWFLSALTAAQVDTLQTLRLLGISLRTYLGL